MIRILSQIQVLLVKSSDHWQDILTQGKISRLHLLEPTSLQVKAALCVVHDDPRLPKTRLHAKIPSIGVSVTEQRVLDALSLVTSIPLPESETTPMALNKVKYLNEWVRIWFSLFTFDLCRKVYWLPRVCRWRGIWMSVNRSRKFWRISNEKFPKTK